jgi:hypothetical protein
MNMDPVTADFVDLLRFRFEDMVRKFYLLPYPI